MRKIVAMIAILLIVSCSVIMIKNSPNAIVSQDGTDVKVDSISLLDSSKSKHKNDSITIKQ